MPHYPWRGVILHPCAGAGFHAGCASSRLASIGVEKDPEFFSLACESIQNLRHQNTVGLELYWKYLRAIRRAVGFLVNFEITLLRYSHHCFSAAQDA